MGLFSFIGKALKGVAKVAGVIPGIGGTIKGIAGTVGNLLDHKAPMGSTAKKAVAVLRLGTLGARGNATQGGYAGGMPTAPVLRSSPVMPGGAVATRSGMAPRTASPPRAFGGSSGKSTKRRKPTSSKRSFTKRSSTKRKSRLKFGSPAWRKKYLKKRR